MAPPCPHSLLDAWSFWSIVAVRRHSQRDRRRGGRKGEETHSGVRRVAPVLEARAERPKDCLRRADRSLGEVVML
jgi:hypothetical protein